MANTTVRDSGNNVVAFRTFDTGSGIAAGYVQLDSVTGAPISNTNTLAVGSPQLPSTLGAKPGTTSVSVTLSTDESLVQTTNNLANTAFNTFVTANSTLTSVGRVDDASASSDSAPASLISMFKRGLANWTTLFTRLPTLISGRFPVDVYGSGVLTVSEQDGVAAGGSPFSGNVVATFATIDTAGYGSTAVQLYGTWNATVIWEISNDSVNWIQTYGMNASSAPGSSLPLGYVTTNGLYLFNNTARYIRLRISSYTSGTVQAAVIMRDNVFDLTNVNLAGSSIQLGVIENINASSLGVTSFAFKSAATLNPTLVKAGSGNVSDIIITNNSSSVRYFKLYNKPSQPVTTSDATFYKLAVAAGSTVVLNFAIPLRMTSGISFGITGGLADTDATAIAVDDVCGIINYA